MAKLANLARMTTATTGTGTITLGAAVSGFKTFAQAGITDGMRVSYAIKDGSNSELGEGVYTSSGTTLTRVVASSTNSDSAINLSGAAEVFITPSAASLLRIATPGGRLTLTTLTPVLTSTVTSVATIYYTPYVHRFVPLYDGTSFEMHDFGAELSNATANSSTGKAGPAACTTNSNYDLFVWNDAGTYRLTRGPLWTSDTARGTGAGTTELELVQGIYTNKVAITNGPGANLGTYVGTVRTNGSSTVDYIFGGFASGGTAAVFNLWNMYNRVLVAATVGQSDSSYTYNSATWRELHGNSNVEIRFVRGLNEDGILAQNVMLIFGTPGVAGGYAGIGLDATNALAANARTGYSEGNWAVAVSIYNGLPGLGYHYLAAIERTNNSVTIYSTAPTGAAEQMQMLEATLRA